MGEKIKNTSNEALQRWHQKMPRFFYWIVVIAVGIGTTAFAINTAVPALGGTLHEWWQDIYSYIIGGCVGVVAACKFTVAGGYKTIDPDKIIRGDQLVDRHESVPNMSDVETQHPDDVTHEFDPIDASDM